MSQSRTITFCNLIYESQSGDSLVTSTQTETHTLTPYLSSPFSLSPCPSSCCSSLLFATHSVDARELLGEVHHEGHEQLLSVQRRTHLETRDTTQVTAERQTDRQTDKKTDATQVTADSQTDTTKVIADRQKGDTTQVTDRQTDRRMDGRVEGRAGGQATCVCVVFLVLCIHVDSVVANSAARTRPTMDTCSSFSASSFSFLISSRSAVGSYSPFRRCKPTGERIGVGEGGSLTVYFCQI